MKKAMFFIVGLTLGALPFIPNQAKGDTYFGVLVPMSTPVTLSSNEVSLTIGTSTTLAYSGGDGTGDYRLNNLSNGFCSITVTGVVTANFPGNCSFSVTRLASGKYLDATSPTISITALPEPDKSVISTPSPDPTATPSPTPTATPTATPRPSPTAALTNSLKPEREKIINDSTIKTPANVTLRKVTGVKAALAPSIGLSTYKFSWASNSAALSYSINLVTPQGKRAYTTETASINLEELNPGAYTLEIQAIDGKGKLSTPLLSKFSIPSPKVVKLAAATSLKNPAISKSLSVSLDRFILQTTPGTTMTLLIEYTKSKSNDVNAKKLSSIIEKYIKGKREGIPLKITFSLVEENGDVAAIKGLGEKRSPTLLIRR